MRLVIESPEIWLEQYRDELMEAMGVVASHLELTEAVKYFAPTERHPVGFTAHTPLPEAGEPWVGPSRTQPERLTLSVEEAAKALGISRALCYEAVKRGDVPSLKIGRGVCPHFS